MNDDQSNEDILADLGVEVEIDTKPALTAREERIVAGFEDIQRFVEEHGRKPTHGPDRDIFERLYAVRLDQLRRQADCKKLLTELDHQGLLDGSEDAESVLADDLDDEDILAELGIDVDASDKNDIRNLQNVPPRSTIQMPDQIGKHKPCPDFALFAPMLQTIRDELKSGARKTRPFKDDASVKTGDFFILDGQLLYIATVGDFYVAHGRHKEAQLRVIYDNGTESDIKMRSLQRALNKDENGRRITDNMVGPLFTNEPGEDSTQSGIIYILRSESVDPYIADKRDLIHKIGVTSTSVEQRIANAENDPTYLLAGVKIVATYELFDINRNALEKLLHRFFHDARLSLEIKDRFGKPVEPREWFVVPLHCIEEAIERITDMSIESYKYDIDSSTLIKQQKAK